MFVIYPVCELPGEKVINIFMDQTMFPKVQPVGKKNLGNKVSPKMGNINNELNKDVKNLVSKSKEMISREMQDRLKSKVCVLGVVTMYFFEI